MDPGGCLPHPSYINVYNHHFQIYTANRLGQSQANSMWSIYGLGELEITHDQGGCHTYIQYGKKQNNFLLQSLVVEFQTPDREVGGFDAYLRRVISLSKDTFTHLKVLVIPRKRWPRPDMTKIMLTGTLSINTNKRIFRSLEPKAHNVSL